MDRELLHVANDISPEEIAPDRAVMAMFFYGALLFSSINNLTAIMLALAYPKFADNKDRQERMLTDDVYGAEFIKEMIRINAALPSIPREVDGFDVNFTNVNRPVSFRFDWDKFDAVGVDTMRAFDSFGFGRRQCAARGWLDKIYGYVVKVSEKSVPGTVAPWSVAFAKLPVLNWCARRRTR
ncbi:hypothetical protein M427DRAFT_135514 [Gonapodya prolifera JEL478]|uniref:Cytochrome P450 n=1 Tax=Gonapodya prolifera (strain JEL478) TaxID=1344416 RepID=A0A139AEF7_GONPJ|nr:hypothetical protein M427DRAFT_135514 [Gonapodya prolifera JEL478]|eukprot:KXS14825.1 hypothetical protein M427DRAFT_135514 [Gonapodya prolifera JEL478]